MKTTVEPKKVNIHQVLVGIKSKHLNHISMPKLKLKMKKKHYTEGGKTLGVLKTNSANKPNLLF